MNLSAIGLLLSQSRMASLQDKRVVLVDKDVCERFLELLLLSLASDLIKAAADLDDDDEDDDEEDEEEEDDDEEAW